MQTDCDGDGLWRRSFFRNGTVQYLRAKLSMSRVGLRKEDGKYDQEKWVAVGTKKALAVIVLKSSIAPLDPSSTSLRTASHPTLDETAHSGHGLVEL